MGGRAATGLAKFDYAEPARESIKDAGPKLKDRGSGHIKIMGEARWLVSFCINGFKVKLTIFTRVYCRSTLPQPPGYAF